MRLQDIVPWHARRPAPTTEMTDPFRRMHEEMDRMLSDVFADANWPPVFGARAGGPEAVPHMDVSETDEAIEVTLDMPGVEPDDVDVSLDDGILSITGTRETGGREDERTGISTAWSAFAVASCAVWPCRTVSSKTGSKRIRTRAS